MRSEFIKSKLCNMTMKYSKAVQIQQSGEIDETTQHTLHATVNVIIDKNSWLR